MPIKIPSALPARETLERENIFVMDEHRALHQDIRPLRIAVLNLMPTKITTETQLIRLLSNTSLQIELTLLGTASHTPKHTSAEHMSEFYKNWEDVRSERFDGLVITGAPVENRSFEEVDYWDELCAVMEWSETNVFSTLHICWAAQAGLYYHYGVKKYPLPSKMFGVYRHKVLEPRHPLVRGFDEEFFAPHSRHTEVRSEDIARVPSGPDGCFSSPDTPNTTTTPSRTSTSGTRARDWTSRCRSTISRTTTRRAARSTSGADTRTCSSPTG